MFDHFDPPRRPPVTRLAALVDVTLRDGGFEVDFDWPEATFADVTAGLAPFGVEYVELGYLGGVPLAHGVAAPGRAAHLTVDHISAAQRGPVRLAAMVHPTAVATVPDMNAYAAAGLDMLRLVYHPDWFVDIAALAEAARDSGLTVTVNIAMASRYGYDELVDHAARIDAKMCPDVIYIADTCGALQPDEVARLVRGLRTAVQAQIGFHAHDFLSLAYANALAAAQAGAAFLDCSVLGLGRGGGNLATELMLICHRLAGRHDTSPLARLVDLRTDLATLAKHPDPTLLAVACGALNLTPVEEQAVTDFARGSDLDPSIAALWLTCAAGRVASLRAEDLRTAWHHDGGW
jgi:isopropylmalate/homocitrate/citramalate synthase